MFNLYAHLKYTCFLLVLFSAPVLLGVETNSYYEQKTQKFITEATVVLDVPERIIGEIGGDFPHYRDWALKGINGGEDNPRKFISILKDLIYVDKPTPFGAFVVVYDVDLIFPFGRTDEKLVFRISDWQKSAGFTEGFDLHLDDSSLVIKSFNLKFSLSKPSETQAKIQFKSETELRAIFNPFFSLERYRNNIEWRILRMVDNLKDQIKNLNSINRSKT